MTTITNAELRELVAKARRYGRRAGKNTGIGADEGESIAVCAVAEAIAKWKPGKAPLASFAVGVGMSRIFDERRRLFGGRYFAAVRFTPFESWMAPGTAANLGPARAELASISRFLCDDERELISMMMTGERMDAVSDKTESRSSRLRARALTRIRGLAS